MRVRLSDHAVVLAAAGFDEKKDVARYCRAHGVGSWVRCLWDTPLKISGVGDTLLLCDWESTDQRLRDFYIHELHLLPLHTLSAAYSPLTASQPGVSMVSQERRRLDYRLDSQLDFNTPITVMIWLEVSQYQSTLPRYSPAPRTIPIRSMLSCTHAKISVCGLLITPGRFRKRDYGAMPPR